MKIQADFIPDVVDGMVRWAVGWGDAGERDCVTTLDSFRTTDPNYLLVLAPSIHSSA